MFHFDSDEFPLRVNGKADGKRSTCGDQLVSNRFPVQVMALTCIQDPVDTGVRIYLVYRALFGVDAW
jgi:hypothetical protein